MLLVVFLFLILNSSCYKKSRSSTIETTPRLPAPINSEQNNLGKDNSQNRDKEKSISSIENFVLKREKKELKKAFEALTKTKKIEERHIESEEDNYAKVFSNPKNVVEESDNFVSIDNINYAPANRLLVPKNKKIKDIYELKNYKDRVIEMFTIIKKNLEEGIPAHNRCPDKNTKQVEAIIINTNKCCSKPELLHIQLYNGYKVIPHDTVSDLKVDELKNIFDNKFFEVKEFLGNKKTYGIDKRTLILCKNRDKTILKFFESLVNEEKFLESYLEVLGFYEENYKSIRLFMIPNLEKNEKYKPYEIDGNKFCQYVYACNSAPIYDKYS